MWSEFSLLGQPHLSSLEVDQINPRPVLMIKEALWMDGMGWDGQLPWVIGILKAPLVLINPLIKT